MAAVSSGHRVKVWCYFLGPRFDGCRKAKGSREEGILANEGLKSKFEGKEQKDNFTFNITSSVLQKRHRP